MIRKNQRTESLPLVAVELGSSGVRAMAAERLENGIFHILGVEESEKFPSIEKGNIIQSGNVGYMIAEVLNKLSNRVGAESLPTAFVPVGGTPMMITPVQSKRDNVHSARITKAQLSEMEKECFDKINNKYPEYAVIGVVPAYFLLDGEEFLWDDLVTETQRGTLIEGHYTAFVTKQEVADKIDKSFDQAMRSVEQSFVRPDVLLSAFAQEDGARVLQEGCAVFDFGAQTTALSIYKGTEYLFHKVVPLGGNHITDLLAQQGISMATAERLKCEYGYASASYVQKNLHIRLKATQELGGELQITSTEIADLIESKLKETLGPLLESLDKYKDRIKTIYITGGASMLCGLDAYLQSLTGLTTMYGAHDLLVDRNTEEQYLSPRYSSLVGTLLLGASYRDTHKGELVKPPKLVDKIKDTAITLFSNE